MKESEKLVGDILQRNYFKKFEVLSSIGKMSFEFEDIQVQVNREDKRIIVRYKEYYNENGDDLSTRSTFEIALPLETVFTYAGADAFGTKYQAVVDGMYIYIII